MLPTMQVLVENIMYISWGDMQSSVGGSNHSCSCEDPSLTSQYNQPVGASSCPQQIFYVKTLTPKDGVRFVLLSLTNVGNQVDSIILRGPCFVSCM